MKLQSVNISGFKSIRDQTINIGDITIVTGNSGSGKTNLVLFFEMARYLANNSLCYYVGRHGADSILYYGHDYTRELCFNMKFDCDEYNAKMTYDNPHRLLLDESNRINTNIGVYCLNDFSDTSAIKRFCYIDDAKELRKDGGNLASFLKMLKDCDEYQSYYYRIVEAVKEVFPRFGGFKLESWPGNKNCTILNWYDSYNADYVFGPHQMSDGMLKFVFLATLFLQHPVLMPNIIVVDDVESGLCRFSTYHLTNIIKMASRHSQIVLTTQSDYIIRNLSKKGNFIVADYDDKKHCSVYDELNLNGVGGVNGA